MDEVQPYAFAYCEKLVKVHVPDTVEVVADRAFYHWDATNEKNMYCTQDSVAYKYAIKNNFKVVLQ